MNGRSWSGIAVVAWVLASASPASREMRPTEWPLERIVANLEAHLTESPHDADAHATLGRAHAFAFALERSSLWTVGGGRYVHERWKQRELDQLRPVDQTATPAPAPEQRLVHLAEGVRHLTQACALGKEPAPAKARYHLTLAWLLESGAPFAAQVDTPALLGEAGAVPAGADEARVRRWVEELGASDAAAATLAEEQLAAPENLPRALAALYAARASAEPRRREGVERLLRRAWIERAIAEYARAIDLAFPTESAGEGMPARNEEELRHMTSYEALEGWRRLVQQRGVRADEESRLGRIDAMLKQLEDLPRSDWITPMVVSLDCAAMDDLLLPGVSVPFDLDGDGIDELWPWLAPEAGWLVWDPEQRGEITSGRQLFGTASAWLFFEDGYRVLDALDDDRSGRLAGAELTGIAVWFDRDTDGISDRGEVVPVEELGITALVTQATLRIGAAPANLCGIEMEDGRVLPSYDWVLAPVTE